MKRAWILSAVAAVLLTGCYVTPASVRVPLPPSPGEVASHLFQYYPGPEVYFDPSVRIHYYREGGVWRSAPVLPPTIILHGLVPERVELNTTVPYQHHDEVRKRYPPGIQKKRDRDGDDDGRGKGRDRDRDGDRYRDR